VTAFDRHILVLILVVIPLTAGCDTASPPAGSTMVVEAWLNTASPLPSIRVSSTRALSDALTPEPAQPGTRLEVALEDRTVAYERSPEDPLWFRPIDPENAPAAAGDRFDLRIDAPETSIRASGVMPPEVTLRNVDISAPALPISAVLIDSLSVGLDSLNLAVNASTGYIYPVQVSLTWDDDAFDGWIETRLQPDDAFSSSLIDFFLLPSQVFRESSARVLEDGSLQWEGVYAVPVASPQSPLPVHSLRVFIRRGDDRFARFVTSRDAPNRREPVTNVSGGLGFVGGVSTDSIRIDISQ